MLDAALMNAVDVRAPELQIDPAPTTDARPDRHTPPTRTTEQPLVNLMSSTQGNANTTTAPHLSQFRTDECTPARGCRR